MIYTILQGIHVLGGIFWFGAVLFSDFILIPVIQRLAPKTQQEILGPLMPRIHRFLLPAASVTIIAGILLGMNQGVFDQLGTSYGITWILSILFALFILFWGARVTQPAAQKLQKMEPGTPEHADQIKRTQLIAMFELLWFVVLYLFMVAMRFGY